MSDAPLDLLLEEVRISYKSELDRYNQLYGRIGVFMAVFALYANALVWFFQNGLTSDHGPVGLVAVFMLLAVTTIGFGFLLLALRGNTLLAAQGPQFWRERRDVLRQPVYAQLVAEGTAAPTEDQIDERVATALKQDLVADFARCTESNMNLNERRFGFLHLASQLAGLGFLVFMLVAGVYVYSVWHKPRTPTSRVQIVEPVQVKLDTGGRKTP